MNPVQQWTGKLGFIASLAGAAVGLGNIWRFPYLVGQGGGLFIILYALSMLILVAPIMYFEICMGQYAKRSPLSAFAHVNRTYHAPRIFYGIGLLGIVIVFITLSFYSVVSGWVIYYLVKSGNLDNFATMSQSIQQWDSFMANPTLAILFAWVFLFINWLVLIKGVQKGLERLNKVLIPMLFLLLLGMLLYAVYLPSYSATEALRYLTRIDLPLLNRSLFMDALGQALFTLAVGAGAIMTYGAYLPQKSDKLLTTSYIIIFVQLVISILIGLVIYSIVLSDNSAEFSAGPSMIFITLPLFFAQMPHGAIIAVMFFIITFFAAITSSINIAEPMIFGLEDKLKFSRKKASTVVILTMLFTSALLVLSFNCFASVTIFGSILFDAAVNSVTNYLMPVASFFFSIYAGWFLSETLLIKFTDNKKNYLYQYLRFSLRYVFPVALIVVQIFG